MDVAVSDRRGTHQRNGAAARDLGLQRLLGFPKPRV